MNVFDQLANFMFWFALGWMSGEVLIIIWKRYASFFYGVIEFRRMKTFRFAPLNRRAGDWSQYQRYQAGQRFAHWCTFGYWEH